MLRRIQEEFSSTKLPSIYSALSILQSFQDKSDLNPRCSRRDLPTSEDRNKRRLTSTVDNAPKKQQQQQQEPDTAGFLYTPV
jgi:hypothetical protein